MKALLRPAFVLGLSIAIAATSLVGSSSVARAASTVVTWTVDGSIQRDLVWDVYQGAPVSLTGTLTSAAGFGPYTLDIDWGDGSSQQSVEARCEVVPPNPCPALRVQKATPYTDQPSLPIVILFDAPAAANRSVLRVNVLPNLPPSITSFEVTAGPEGGSSTLALTFTDLEVTDTHTVSVVWGDGATTSSEVLPASQAAFNAAHVFADSETYTVGVTLSDNAGNSVTDSKSVTPTNVGPVVGALTLSANPVVEQKDLTVTGTFTDPGTKDTFTLSVNWGDGTSSPDVLLGKTREFRATHAYATARTVTITATVTDSDGDSGSSTAELVVEPGNHAPSGLAFNATATGANVVLTGTFTDPDATDTHTVALNWGDGATQEIDAQGRAFTVPHVYAVSKTYMVTANVIDHPTGATASPLSHEVVVTIAPSGLAFDATPAGANVVVTGTFTDPDATDAHTLTVTWGDGVSERQSLVVGDRLFTSAHVYLQSGPYTVTATVADAAGQTSATRQVVVTVPATTASAVLDEMSSLVLSFDLDRNTARWLVRKLDDLRGSLAYGNDQICSTSGTLAHLVAFAQRTLSPEQYAALSADSAQLQTAAGCTSTANQLPKVQGAAAVTTAATPSSAPKKDTTTQVAAKDTAKSTKAESKAMPGRSAH